MPTNRANEAGEPAVGAGAEPVDEPGAPGRVGAVAVDDFAVERGGATGWETVALLLAVWAVGVGVDVAAALPAPVRWLLERLVVVEFCGVVINVAGGWGATAVGKVTGGESKLVGS